MRKLGVGSWRDSAAYAAEVGYQLPVTFRVSFVWSMWAQTAQKFASFTRRSFISFVGVYKAPGLCSSIPCPFLGLSHIILDRFISVGYKVLPIIHTTNKSKDDLINYLVTNRSLV